MHHMEAVRPAAAAGASACRKWAGRAAHHLPGRRAPVAQERRLRRRTTAPMRRCSPAGFRAPPQTVRPEVGPVAVWSCPLRGNHVPPDHEVHPEAAAMHPATAGSAAPPQASPAHRAASAGSARLRPGARRPGVRRWATRDHRRPGRRGVAEAPAASSARRAAEAAAGKWGACHGRRVDRVLDLPAGTATSGGHLPRGRHARRSRVGLQDRRRGNAVGCVYVGSRLRPVRTPVGDHSAAVLRRGRRLSTPPVPRTYDCTRWFQLHVRQTSTT